eukprot:scaffold7375_cov268-Pinguiococcus_pyrenoidosus.AAC.54
MRYGSENVAHNLAERALDLPDCPKRVSTSIDAVYPKEAAPSLAAWSFRDESDEGELQSERHLPLLGLANRKER